MAPTIRATEIRAGLMPRAAAAGPRRESAAAPLAPVRMESALVGPAEPAQVEAVQAELVQAEPVQAVHPT
jgi:hypothetical protein